MKTKITPKITLKTSIDLVKELKMLQKERDDAIKAVKYCEEILEIRIKQEEKEHAENWDALTLEQQRGLIKMISIPKVWIQNNVWTQTD